MRRSGSQRRRYLNVWHVSFQASREELLPRKKLPFSQIWTRNVAFALITAAFFDFPLGAFTNLWTLFLWTPRSSSDLSTQTRSPFLRGRCWCARANHQTRKLNPWPPWHGSLTLPLSHHTWPSRNPPFLPHFPPPIPPGVFFGSIPLAPPSHQRNSGSSIVRTPDLEWDHARSSASGYSANIHTSREHYIVE